MEQAVALLGRVGLADRIQEAILPYKDTDKKPPFTPDELFTMVIAVTGRLVTKGQVLRWVLDNFGYYRKMIEEEFVDDDPEQFHSNDLYFWRSPETQSGRFRANINEVPRNYELYLTTESAGEGSNKYTMTVASCERVLSHALASQNGLGEKSFRLFDLPPEVRNMIFDLVFQYPRSGLLFTAKGQKTAIIDSPADRDTCTSSKSRTLPKTARITDILAPLLVNRQFYKEAKGCFFAVNHFHFADGDIMAWTLARMSESQRQHIQHVTLDFVMWACERRDALALLATCGLTKLNLYLDEDKWKEYGTTRRGKIFKNRSDVMNIPGLRKLRAMRGLDEVNFYGCPTVEALIKADMLKPKPKPKPKKKGKGGTKRKAEGDSAGGKKIIRR